MTMTTPPPPSPPDTDREAVPVVAEQFLHIFGVDYRLLRFEDGGELYLTEYGLPLRSWLDPQRWYAQGRYAREGHRLPGGTGSVFRFDVAHEPRPISLVVKVSRVAQDVPIAWVRTYRQDVTTSLMDTARFNGPFEEFGMLMALRRSRKGPPDMRLLTKRPLAIYCPPRRYPTWRLGRSESVWRQYEASLHQHERIDTRDQPIQQDPQRDYILLYGWVKGIDAVELNELGLLDEDTMIQMTRRATAEMAARGFRVLDHKPRHLVLRLGRDGRLLRDHNGLYAYALIDFELLMPLDADRLPDV